MNIKARAIHAEDKEERRHTILDAAERLLLAHTQRIASVDEVAAEAGLAKGTVYLYFPSKEELLLAIHDRNSERFFDALLHLLEEKKSVDFDDLFLLVRKYMIDAPGFLPLAALCFGLMEKSVPVEAAATHKERIGNRLQTASVGLERQFPRLGEGQGVALLMHSYALIVGLWQMIHPSPLREALADVPACDMFHRDYAVELESGLRRLWEGYLADQESRVGRQPSLDKVNGKTLRRKS
jgi:AcrR family transcriptional regulator